MLVKENILVQSSKVLPTIFPFYGVCQQSELCWVLSEIKKMIVSIYPTLMPELVVDRVWHSDGV